MTLIEWRKEFATGISGVDYEHEEMISLINSFHSELSHDSDKESLINALNNIYGAIYSHFVLEERLMEKHGYPHYEEHSHDHMRLLDDIRAITDELEATAQYNEQQLGQKLNDWFSIHFKTHDARLHKLEQLIASGQSDENEPKSLFKKAKDTIFGKNP